MALLKPIQMATDIRGQVTYAVSPPSVYRWGVILAANTAQDITLPLTPDSNVPWQVFFRYVNTSLVASVWVVETPVGVSPITPDLPTGTIGIVNSQLEPAAWTLPGGWSLSFISPNDGDQVSIVAYLGVRGNY